VGSPLRTPLCDLLGIDYAIVLAPMTNGPSTPELVAAVSGAGGLGMYGVQGLSVDAVSEAVDATLALTSAPFGVNVQLAEPFERGDAAAMRAVLAPLRQALGLPVDPPARPLPDSALALLEAAAEAGAPILSVALGDPEPAVPIARAAGVPLVAMVSTVAEARRCAELGVDVVIAQGSEAGGHRTTFEVRHGEPPPLIGTMALVPQVVDAVDMPVVAAGGIADGRGVAAALALGAAGACLGTRFMTATESGIAPVYRERLRAARDEDTLVTDAVTGRPARWVRNRTVDALRDVSVPLGWGAQAAAIADVRAAAAAAGDADLLPMLAGQAAGLESEELPAAEIVGRLVAEASAVLRRLS
jgi:nitronate monooxygenase